MMRKTYDSQLTAQHQGKIMVRKIYHKPVLTQFKDLRTVTLGSSPGGQESGGPTGIIPFKRAGT